MLRLDPTILSWFVPTYQARGRGGPAADAPGGDWDNLISEFNARGIHAAQVEKEIAAARQAARAYRRAHKAEWEDEEARARAASSASLSTLYQKFPEAERLSRPVLLDFGRRQE